VGEREAAREEHLGQVAQAEFVAKPPEHHEQGDVGRDLQMIEGRTRPFIEGAPAGATTEQAIPQRRHPLQLLCRIPLAVWAAHRPLLSTPLKGEGYSTAWLPTTSDSEF